jgi:hypothetical protein
MPRLNVKKTLSQISLMAKGINMSGLNIDIEIELLLDILLKTTRTYMEAFEIPSDDIDMSCDMIKKYQAFRKIVALYLDSSDEVIAFVSFNYDWINYKVNLASNDPDVLIARKSILGMTPKRILEEACDVIKQKVHDIKSEREYCKLRLVYYYSDEVSNNAAILQKIRSEAGLVPFDLKTLKYSKKLEGYQTSISSSVAEKTLAIDFIT